MIKLALPSPGVHRVQNQVPKLSSKLGLKIFTFHGASWGFLGTEKGTVQKCVFFQQNSRMAENHHFHIGTHLALGPSCGRLGGVLGAPWGHLGASLGILGASWGVLGRLGGIS